MGARVGLSAASLSGTQLVLTVAPKLWRPRSASTILVSDWPDQAHIELSLYELDRLQVTSRDNRRTDCIDAMLRASRKSKDGGVSWDSSLLVPDVTNARGVARDGIANLGTQTVNILRLFERVSLLWSDTDDLVGSPRRSPLHRPLVYRRFLREVTMRVKSARRGYVPIRADRTAIRGRVDPVSLARFQCGGSSSITCSFDELTESTHLLGVICSALEWIADGLSVTSVLPDEFAGVRLRHEAVVLRRALAEVRTTPPRQALAAGRRLRLNRLDQPWATALRLAISILGEYEAIASPTGNRDVDAVELSVPTEKLWERIVGEALAKTGFDAVLSPRHQWSGLTEHPWIARPPGPSRARPDNVAMRDSEVFVVDAKYKTPPDGGSPLRSDQYQMFAYTHLVRDDPRRVRAAVLVYPGAAKKQTWLRGRDDASTPIKLFSVSIPFPLPVDLSSPSAWASYLERSAERLSTELGAVQTLIEDSAA